ncbi:MAG TPA: ATP phosphoribosyltransferase [Halanaerobiaceae bacterium]|nr:ATP phosphoribosyltransferase [Bacillota bacterium]HHU93307.1 ATP phosphoribosyltransferase [Halanaerobiaceae bacterium]HOA40962.1 ATP phosphoribosyltransferase [Halanaerobiales bacterium]HPZ62781.1 ATP phosphoribosyltransferase [Halanaerobiales bacterium]HQD04311.1 ATP phosphoribosyltransferase [Halanaerobiales bacterium]
MGEIITALPKGRLMGVVVDILKEAGFISRDLNIEELSRKLVFKDEETGNSFLLAKPKDVPVYVEHGAADIGITGKDVILEHGKRIYELADLEVGYCQLVVAVPEEKGIKKLEEIPEYSRVATSYPNITREFFQQKGIQVEIIHLYGSVELAPLVDLADLIVDITSTGTTLRKNRLIPIATITESTSRLIVNSVSYKTRYDFINGLMARLKK